MGKRRLLVLLLMGVFACREEAPSKPAAPVPSAATTGAATATGTSAAGTSAAGTGAAGAGVAAEDPIFAALKGRPQKADTKPSETVRDAGGVFLGLPAGWRTVDTNVPAPGLGYTADHGGCLEFSPPEKTGERNYYYARLCAVQMSELPAVSGRIKASLELYGFYMTFDKAKWAPWADGTVGDGFKAKVTRGAHGNREGFAAHVEIPGRKSIFILGRWMNDEEKEAVFEIVRGLGTCTFSADKRKCTPDKPYR